MSNNSSIKEKAITGAIWKFMERICAQVVSMAVTIILARILEPDDFSPVSIVAIFFSFANVFINGGFNSALIQKKDADEDDYSSVLLLSLCSSLIIYMALFCAAPFVASIYNKPILVKIIRIMGLILPVNAVKSVVCAYISSHLMFRKFFMATIIGTVISGVIGIGMAYFGFGAWALVAQQMSNTIIDTIILYVTTRIVFSWRISWEKLKGLFSYGWRIFMTSIVATLYTEINPMFIGIRYTGRDLAYYSKGRSFPSLLSTVSNSTLSSVLFPVLSKFQTDKEELLRCTRRFIRTGSYIIFPVMLGFRAVSENFVRIVLTEKWLPSVFYMKIFCFSEMFASIHCGNCEAIKAMGRSDVFLKMEIIKKSCYFAVIAIAMFTTSTPQALALSGIGCTAVAIVVNCVPNIWLMQYRVKDQFKDILPNLCCAIFMYATVRVVNINNSFKIVELIVQIFIGVISYIGISIATKNENLTYILSSVKNILCKKKQGISK